MSTDKTDTHIGVTHVGPLRWEPRSLSTVEQDRVLIDVLADVYADGYRPGVDPSFQKLEFRERLEQAVQCATGVPLCGLPAAFRKPFEPRRALDMAADHPGHAHGADR